MAASIKRNAVESPEEGAREICGVTDGKSYAVQGYTGGGVVFVNDEGKFSHVSFADIEAVWSVTDNDAAKDKGADKKAKPEPTAAPSTSTPTPTPTVQEPPAPPVEGAQTTT